jgi:DNA-binding MarR family transcriptional regulator
MRSDSTKILSLMFAIGRQMRDEGKNSMLHFQTLRYVQERGNPFMQDVAGYLCVTPSAATLLIDGLVKEKLLSRSFDIRDRRAVRVTLTESGKRFLARGIRKKMDKLKKIFAVLTAKERARFIVILQKIAKHSNR